MSLQFKFSVHPCILIKLCCLVLRLQSVFSSKSVKKSVTCGVRVLCARTARASHALRACEAREKKASLLSLALCFQPLTARAYLNTQKYRLFCSLLSFLSKYQSVSLGSEVCMILAFPSHPFVSVFAYFRSFALNS